MGLVRGDASPASPVAASLRLPCTLSRLVWCGGGACELRYKDKEKAKSYARLQAERRAISAAREERSRECTAMYCDTKCTAISADLALSLAIAPATAPLSCLHLVARASEMVRTFSIRALSSG